MNYLESFQCPHHFIVRNRHLEPLLGLDDRIKAKLLHDLSFEGDLSQHLAKLDSREITQIKMINLDDSEVTIEGEAGALRKTIDAYKEHVLKTPPAEIQFSIKRTPYHEESFRIFEEAKKTAIGNMKNALKSVQKLGFDPKDPLDKILLFELAKLGAAYFEGFSQYIQNFGFDVKDSLDKEMLFEIAKIAAARDGKITSRYIKNYGFDVKNPEDNEMLFEIAKIAAGDDSFGTTEYIVNYGFEDKEKLFDVAKIAAIKDGSRTSELIAEYGFDVTDPQDKEKLFEIAKLAAGNDDSGTSYHINNYGFDAKEDKEKLYEIAKIAAAKNGGDTSAYIEKYGFDAKEDKEKLYEIAKIAADSEYIQNYGFDAKDPQDKKKLIEIIKIAAAKNSTETCQCIKNYGFDIKNPEDKELIFEIIKLAAKNDALRISMKIKEYGFDVKAPEDKKKLYEIAKIAAAAKNGMATLTYIKNYGFDVKDPQDRELLFAIAKLILSQNYNPADVSQIFVNLIHNIFYLNDQESNQHIINAFRVLYPQNPASFLQHLIRSDKPVIAKLGRILKQMQAEDIGELKKASSSQALIEAFEKLENETNPRGKTSAVQYLGFLLCQSLMVKDQALFAQNIKTFVPLLEKVYDPALRLNIIGLTGELLGSLEPKKEKEFLQLPLLLYDALFSSEKPREAIIKLNRHLRDGKMLKSLMNTLIELHHSGAESAELIERALNKPKSFSESLKQLNLLSAILNLDGADLLKDRLSTFATQLEKAFIRKVPAIAAEEGFADKFLTTFQQSRAPSAIFQYAASLSKLEGVALKNSQSALATFISSVLNGSYLSERMKLENNPHLQILHNQYPEILKKWAQGKSKEIETESKNTRSIPEQLHNFFATKIKDQHLKEVDLFADYLKENKNALLKKLDALPEGSLQKILTQIIDPKFVTFKADRQSKLIEQLKEATPKDSPFLNDLPLLEEIIKGKSIMGKKFIQLTSTDNPYDLLLAGTEVVGSCQNITGSPRLNRGLLGYLLNGHRMITLKEVSKNPNQEPIIGRAIFRLLLDEENNPTLLLERIYPQNLADSYKAALKEFAIECAEDLGCPVVSAEEGNKAKPFGKDVKSLGGRVDEYVDAAAGIQLGAVYTTSDAYYVTG